LVLLLVPVVVWGQGSGEERLTLLFDEFDGSTGYLYDFIEWFRVRGEGFGGTNSHYDCRSVLLYVEGILEEARERGYTMTTRDFTAELVLAKERLEEEEWCDDDWTYPCWYCEGPGDTDSPLYLAFEVLETLESEGYYEAPELTWWSWDGHWAECEYSGSYFLNTSLNPVLWTNYPCLYGGLEVRLRCSDDNNLESDTGGAMDGGGWVLASLPTLTGL
jgi:hypothetical protein